MSEFSSIRQVNEEFYKLFLGKCTKRMLAPGYPLLPFLPLGDAWALVRHARRGGGSDTEELPVTYPAVNIHNFQPSIDRKRTFRLPTVTEGDYSLNEDGDWEGSLLPLAVPMEFMFQVDFTAEKETDARGFQEWMLREFDADHAEPCFLMNRVQTADGDLGAVVPYRVEVTEIPRDDKFYEYAYTFYLYPSIYLKLPKERVSKVSSLTISNLMKELEGE